MSGLVGVIEKVAGVEESISQPAVETALPVVSPADITVDQLVFHESYGYGEVIQSAFTRYVKALGCRGQS